MARLICPHSLIKRMESPLIIYCSINYLLGWSAMKAKGDRKPLASINLTEYFDRVEVDVKADLSDWHKVRRELRGR